MLSAVFGCPGLSFWQTSQLLARLSIHVDGAQVPTPVLQIHLPLGLAIPQGVTMQVDNQAPQRLDIATCEANGCYARGSLSRQLLDSLKGGKQAKVRFQNLQGKSISVNFSLADFTTTYARIE